MYGVAVPCHEMDQSCAISVDRFLLVYWALHAGGNVLDDYNYRHFPTTGEKADKFEAFFEAPNVGTVVPDFALEDLESGVPLHLKELWKIDAVPMEFGSYG